MAEAHTPPIPTCSRSADPYLLGYAGKWPDVRWPNGARVAVSLVVNYEEGAEFSVGTGDNRNEACGELQSSVPREQRDIAMEQTFAYGTRAGYWRVLDALARHRFLATYLFCGRAVERTPELAILAVQQGHEAACHGYRWANHTLFASEAEEEHSLRRAIDALEGAGCGKPAGFYGRWGPSPATRAILRRLGFLYDSNAYDDDLPYYDIDDSGSALLVIPYALDTNDYKYFEGDPWGTGEAYLQYLKTSLTVLLAEGGRGYPRVLNVGLHLRIIGRPGRSWALGEFLTHLRTLGDQVWVARRVDIARHWLTAVPPPIAKTPAELSSRSREPSA
jgi:peptidoglycan/xylan/chitin deacetylase (PgdA/CDA1 family)